MYTIYNVFILYIGKLLNKNIVYNILYTNI